MIPDFNSSVILTSSSQKRRLTLWPVIQIKGYQVQTEDTDGLEKRVLVDGRSFTI